VKKDPSLHYHLHHLDVLQHVKEVIVLSQEVNVDEHVKINAYSMSFLGKTILVPEGDVPDTFIFFKEIVEKIPRGTHISVTRKDHFSPVLVTVVFSYVYENLLSFLVMGDKDYTYSVNTVDHYIIEETPVKGREFVKLENIGDAEENELIQLLKHDSLDKIPKELWDRPSFKRKIELERTKGRLRMVDTIGDTTGTLYTEIPHDTLRHINDFLGVETDPVELNAAIQRKTMRLAPKCKGSKCSISGGTRKNKNKKKRYGRL
jgi:hypothetical protein